MRNSDSHRGLLRVVSACLGVGMAGLALTACGSKGDAGKSTTTTIAHSTTTTAGSEGGSTPTTTPYTIPVVQRGTGPATLSNFSVPSKAKEWDLDWVYDCSKTPTKKGSFAVTIVGHGLAADTTDAGVPEQQGGGTSGIVKNYDIGTFNLKVASTCTWDVRVEIMT